KVSPPNSSQTLRSTTRTPPPLRCPVAEQPSPGSSTGSTWSTRAWCRPPSGAPTSWNARSPVARGCWPEWAANPEAARLLLDHGAEPGGRLSVARARHAVHRGSGGLIEERGGGLGGFASFLLGPDGGVARRRHRSGFCAIGAGADQFPLELLVSLLQRCH